MKYWLSIIVCAIYTTLNASIVCPIDRTITCDMDIHNLDMLGEPTAFGSHAGAPFSYQDSDQRNGCGIGKIYRTWFINLNNTGVPAGNPSCVQEITVNEVDGFEFSIRWPSNQFLNCVEDIEFQAPIITAGPCEQSGYSYDDQVFELAEDACYKILRKFTVINWCEQNDGDPSTTGIYYHTQIIKVTEEDAPVIADVDDVTIAMNENCLAEVVLSNSATDVGECPSSELYWTVRVDLNWDFVYEYEYSYFLTGDQHLPATANGESLDITLPELVEGGTHGVEYSVRDACGNVDKITKKVHVRDLKAPTPYCHLFLTAAFDADAMPAMIPARLFDIGATDNCTPGERIKLSFSEDVNDTIKVITCGNQGFQFFRIYVTDDAGNQDFCEAYMLIFDNDGCGFRYAPTGRLVDFNGQPVADHDFLMMNGLTGEYQAKSDANGVFAFSETELVEGMYVMAKTESNDFEPNILHLKQLQDHLIGNTSFDRDEAYYMSDLNADKKLNAQDMLALRDHLLAKELLPASTWQKAVNAQSMTEGWKSYSTTMDYEAYEGAFDFVLLTYEELFGQEEESRTVVQPSLDSEEGWQLWSTPLDNLDEIQGLSIEAQLAEGLVLDQIIVRIGQQELPASSYNYDELTGLLKVAHINRVEWSAGERIQLRVESDNAPKINSLDIIVDEKLEKCIVNTEKTNTQILSSNLVDQQLILNSGLGQAHIRILNHMGQTVWQDLSRETIEVGHLPAGLYWLEWQLDGQSIVERFYKQ